MTWAFSMKRTLQISKNKQFVRLKKRKYVLTYVGTYKNCFQKCEIQCNLDLVTLWSPQKLSLNRIMSLNQMILCSKFKNGLCKIVTKSQVVTKFNVTKSRLHCTWPNFRLTKKCHLCTQKDQCMQCHLTLLKRTIFYLT